MEVEASFPAGGESFVRAYVEGVHTRGSHADPASEWQECGTWETDGPAVLMAAATADAELNVEYPR
ncbi:hypothetical protein GXW82_00085 [Streptacidiphilus sp. 4-A2]|nr:hypothetical protein [Streptacidiphilus sp. 4-A2]